LTRRRSKRALLALGHYASWPNSHGAEQFLTAATSAVREAPNGASFLQMVQDRHGLERWIWSAVRKSPLIYLGCSRHWPSVIRPNLHPRHRRRLHRT